MSKVELGYLKKVFNSQIHGRLYAVENSISERLELKGYILKTSRVVCQDRNGTVKVEGFCLTLDGNLALCSDISENQKAGNAVWAN